MQRVFLDAKPGTYTTRVQTPEYLRVGEKSDLHRHRLRLEGAMLSLALVGQAIHIDKHMQFSLFDALDGRVNVQLSHVDDMLGMCFDLHAPVGVVVL